MKYLLLLFSLFILYSSCNKPHCGYKDFILPVTFTPADSVIMLGDTITVTSKFPSYLWDKDSTDVFIFDSIDFHMVCGFQKIDTFNGSQILKFTRDAVDIIIDTTRYNFIMLNYGFVFDYYYYDDYYYIQFKAVPKQRGVYFFGFSSLLTSTDEFFLQKPYIYTKDRDCKTNTWTPLLITNNGKDNNGEFLKLSPDFNYNYTYYRNWNGLNQSGDSGTRCFKVE